MFKKGIIVTAVGLMILALVACSSLNLPGTNAAASQQQAQNGAGVANFDPAKMPVEQKLGYGTLKLEGTPQAITAEQAKTLLPLWKAVKALNTSSTTSTAEINALYKQIQDSLTPDQVQAIQTMTWTNTDMAATMKQYGIQQAQGQGGFANLSPEQRATRVAQFQAQGGGNRTGGGGNGGAGFAGGGGGGGFAGGGPGGFAGGGQNGQTVQRTPNPQRTPGAGGARRGGGFNTLFADAVIKLLQQKAGA